MKSSFTNKSGMIIILTPVLTLKISTSVFKETITFYGRLGGIPYEGRQTNLVLLRGLDL